MEEASRRSVPRPKLLVFGYGNPSRGDDAIGPTCIQWMEAQGPNLGDLIELRLQTDFQLQIEHALDLEGADRVLFIDASIDCEAPFQVSLVHPARNSSHSTHAISPAAVLEVYQQLFHRPPPPTWMLAVRGVRFELGAALSPLAESHIESACTLLKAICLGRHPLWDASSLGPASARYGRRSRTGS